MEDGRFRDKKEISTENLNEYLTKSNSTVSSEPPSVEEYEQFFADALEHAEQVLHISLASGSGRGYERALKASKGFSNVHVIDGEHVSTGLGCLVMMAAFMMNREHSFEEIVGAVETVKKQIVFQYVVSTAEVMHRRGYLTKYQKNILNGLNLKPVLTVREGKMVLSSLLKGSNIQLYKRFIRKSLKGKRNVDPRVLFLSYAGCSSKELELIKEEVMKYQKFDIIIEEPTSATITSNCGLGSIGIAYLKTK